LSVGKHLESDQHLASGAMQLLDYPELYVVKIEIRVGFTDEQQPDIGQSLGQLLWCDGLARTGIRNAVELKLYFLVFARRVADFHVQNGLVGPHGTGQDEAKNGDPETGRMGGAWLIHR